MSRLISATVQDKRVLETPLGNRVHLRFRTIDGHDIAIRAPIEDCYLANIELLDRVFFQRDRYGCHHLQRQSFGTMLKSIFSHKPSYSSKLLNKII
jgi:hypothetical protein